MFCVFYPFGVFEVLGQAVADQYSQNLRADADLQQSDAARRMFDAIDPNVVDLPADAVREVRDVPRLTGYERPVQPLASALFGFSDSDGGECD
ncbi:hypothetical protein [Paraburkholderia rhynchosiae]|uniref:Uncharacterized protein n=1 Tax=Paraburkholderia rhynchosiae TaxID=487049 RepID=A0A2N7W9B6_9BURK|nr:hypothetical protein [Paraburkholderia rhynchosiae]PMS25982.1 hypothetical protein C0Z16_28015 [Paraburkholderia rhynchosiae]CAB3730804.1 hypothetical protein LMG27174_05780 [Paraburkholderia rhynchosiae]